MKKNNKSGLCLKNLLLIILAILIFASIQVILLKNNDIVTATTNLENKIQKEVANTETNNEIEEKEEQQLVETASTTRESEDTTSRSTTLNRESTEQIETQELITEEENSVEEEVIEELVEEPQYISIEEIKISKDMDLTQRCGISKEDFKLLMTNLKTDTSGFFEENSDIIYDVCEKYELNEIFFCGLIAGESGWNISSNHKRTNNYISMMSGGKLISYSTVKEGLEAAANLLHSKYLTQGGAFYSGKTLSAVKKKFCPSSSTWVSLIYGCMSQIV